jgi:hypothetical protein
LGKGRSSIADKRSRERSANQPPKSNMMVLMNRPETKVFGQVQIGLADAKKTAISCGPRNWVFGQGVFWGWPSPQRAIFDH